MNKTKELTWNAVFVILYSISAKIVIPLGILPFTLQTAVVVMAGILLTPRMILQSYGCYLLLGLMGFPVFATGGGIAYMLQPSFGYLLGFPIAALFIAFWLRHKVYSYLQTLWIALLALGILYSIGCTYMYGVMRYLMHQQISITTVIGLGVIPFLLNDIISISIGIACALRLKTTALLQHTIYTRQKHS